MSKSKRDILDTESMIQRLMNVLAEHAPSVLPASMLRADAESLRRISMTLHRWHELECGGANDSDKCSTELARGRRVSGKNFEYDENGSPYLFFHWNDGRTTNCRINDCEAGALARLKKIMANYPGLTAYVQTDPRGCALYVLKPGDVPEGAEVSSCYSRGLAVYK